MEPPSLARRQPVAIIITPDLAWARELQQLVEQHDWRLAAYASTPEDALWAISNHQPDLVMLDWQPQLSPAVLTAMQAGLPAMLVALHPDPDSIRETIPKYGISFVLNRMLQPRNIIPILTVARPGFGRD